jgi:hypothetical protein
VSSAWRASVNRVLGLAKNGLPRETLAHRGTTVAATTARSCEAGFKDGTARGWTLREQREDRQARSVRPEPAGRINERAPDTSSLPRELGAPTPPAVEERLHVGQRGDA